MRRVAVPVVCKVFFFVCFCVFSELALSCRPSMFRAAYGSMEQLVNGLEHRATPNERVRSAMLSVDRVHYVSGDYGPSMAYIDSPQSIGYGVTISAPHMHYHALDLLEPFLKPGMKVLDVGCGSGYLCAAFAKLVGEGGVVVGIDILPELVEMSKDNIQMGNPEILPSVKLALADGCMGYEDDAPYNAIHVGAAAKRVPDELIKQLASPGRMLIPVGPQGMTQQFLQVDKDSSGVVTTKSLFGVSYVPLVNS